MDVKTCRKCRRLFNYISGPMICPECKEEAEKKFYEAKEYIRDNPHVGIKEVAEAVDVTPTQVQQWIREERLQFAEDSNIALQCEKCGAKIFTGRYCENCKAKMANNLTKAFESAPAEAPKKNKTGNKMRFKK